MAIAAGAALVSGLSYAAAAALTTAITFSVQAMFAYALVAAGMSVLSRALAPKPSLGAQLRGITQTTREPAGTRKLIYGQMRVGGNVVFIQHSGSDNKYLHLVVVFATHHINSFEEFYFNDKKIWTLSGGFQGNWGTYVQLNTKLGTDTQTAVSSLVSASNKWTNDHKLSGIAYAHFRLEWDADEFPQGVPNITAVIKGKRVYDPRTQVFAYSDNPALCLRDYMIDQDYGLGETALNINTQSVIDAANLCEEQVSLDGGGTQDRYTCNGVIDTNNQIKDNIEQLLSAMGGRLTYSGGEYFVNGAEYQAPTVTFDEADCISDIQTQTKQSRRTSYNGVKGIFVSEEKNYKVLDYPPQISSTFATEDGDPIFLDMPLPFVTNNTQAQRLAKIALLKSRQQVIITMAVNLKGLQVKVGDTINVTNDRLGYSSKVFEVIDYSLAIADGGSLAVNLTCIETASAVYDWTTSDQEDFLAGGELDLYDGRTVENVTSLTSSEIGLRGPDGRLKSAVELTWTAPDDAFIEFYTVRFNKNGTTDYFEVQTRQTRALIEGLDLSSNYDFLVQAQNLMGVKSTGTSILNLDLVGDTTDPQLPTNMSATGGVQTITAEWDNPSDIDFKHTEIFVNTTNSIPATPTAAVDGEEYIVTGLSGAETRYFWLKAVDFSGNKSDATASFNGTSVVAAVADITDDVTDKIDEIISTIDEDAAGDGTTDDTTALSNAFNSTNVGTNGLVLDGGNKTYLITSTINVTGAFLRLKNFKFVLGTSYTDQGRINCDAGSGTTKMTIELENIVIDGGRGDYKVGNEPWTVAVSNFLGYDSIQPDLSAVIKVNAFNEETSVRITNCRMENIHALSAIRVNSYGTTIIQDCTFKNMSFKSFEVFQSADNGTTQKGRTLVSDVYAEDIGLLPDTYNVGGVQKTFTDNASTQTESPQGSFNFICSFGEYNITNASVKNYGSCGVTADRNQIFNASNITITNDSTRSFSNNPSGAFWLEDCVLANITNLHIDVSARAGIDTTALDNSLLQIYLTDNTKAFFNNVFVQASETTAYFNKLIRGSLKNTTHCNIENFYVSGLCRNLDDGVSFLMLPNSTISQDVRLAHGYIKHGDIKIEVPFNATVQDVYLEASSGNGDLLFPVAGNSGVTGSVGHATVTGCHIEGAITNSCNFTGSLNIVSNKNIGSIASTGAGNTGKYVISDNARIGGNLAIICAGSTSTAAVEIRGNALIEGVTRVDGANSAIISGNNTERRLTIEDVQNFQVVGNTAKTDAGEPCIWINPTTASNILSGIVTGNNCLIKTGTTGATYVTLASGVTNVMEGLNNKLIVAWS